MIDFRYHVVSLVAVFIALSIGMVVGGFALRGPLADELSNQVKTLRTDKAELRSQLTAAKDGAVKRDAYDAVTLPTIVAGSLTGRRVVILELPNTDGTLLTTTRKTLGSAGASVNGVVTLSSGWSTGKPGVDFSALASDNGLDVQGGSSATLPGVVLAKAVLAPTSATFDRLKSAGLLSADGDLGAADGIVVIWSTSTGDSAQVGRWASVISGASVGAATVLAVDGGKPDATSTDPLMQAVRENPDAAAQLSTVDDGSVPMGQAAVALGLENEFGGKSGHYGTAADATAVIPKTTK